MVGAEGNVGTGLIPPHTPQMFFRAAWSLVLRKGRLGVRGIHSPEGTGKTWIHTLLPCQTPRLGTGVLSAVCPLSLSLLPSAYRNYFLQSYSLALGHILSGNGTQRVSRQQPSPSKLLQGQAPKSQAPRALCSKMEGADRTLDLSRPWWQS